MRLLLMGCVALSRIARDASPWAENSHESDVKMHIGRAGHDPITRLKLLRSKLAVCCNAMKWLLGGGGASVFVKLPLVPDRIYG